MSYIVLVLNNWPHTTCHQEFTGELWETPGEHRMCDSDVQAGFPRTEEIIIKMSNYGGISNITII